MTFVVKLIIFNGISKIFGGLLTFKKSCQKYYFFDILQRQFFDVRIVPLKLSPAQRDRLDIALLIDMVFRPVSGQEFK